MVGMPSGLFLWYFTWSSWVKRICWYPAGSSCWLRQWTQHVVVMRPGWFCHTEHSFSPSRWRWWTSCVLMGGVTLHVGICLCGWLYYRWSTPVSFLGIGWPRHPERVVGEPFSVSWKMWCYCACSWLPELAPTTHSLLRCEFLMFPTNTCKYFLWWSYKYLSLSSCYSLINNMESISLTNV